MKNKAFSQSVLFIVTLAAVACIMFLGSKFMSLNRTTEACEQSTGSHSEVQMQQTESSDSTVSDFAPETAAVITSTSEQQPLTDAAESTIETHETAVCSSIDSIDGVTYAQGILIVNKSFPLPEYYAPGRLTPVTESAFANLQHAAAMDGLSLYCLSGYRSYEHQEKIYNDFVRRDGQDAADTYSARPGYSEHQSGLALDVNCSGKAFDNTPEAIWLEEHCWEYGFIIRYPRGKEAYTGYSYDSSHIRYVGVELAEKLHESGMCLEEYLGIKSEYPS